jgi:hypothetical protein
LLKIDAAALLDLHGRSSTAAPVIEENNAEQQKQKLCRSLNKIHLQNRVLSILGKTLIAV